MPDGGPFPIVRASIEFSPIRFVVRGRPASNKRERLTRAWRHPSSPIRCGCQDADAKAVTQIGIPADPFPIVIPTNEGDTERFAYAYEGWDA